MDQKKGGKGGVINVLMSWLLDGEIYFIYYNIIMILHLFGGAADYQCITEVKKST